MRHGKSAWNEQNLFTGWVDIPLTDNGMQEAIHAGKTIENIPIDCIFTSTLIRAHMTVCISMQAHKSKKIPVFLHQEGSNLQTWGEIYSSDTKNKIIPVYTAWQLNERYYGQLQGLNKEETAKKYGKEQVHIWRRSYDVAPPGGESLKMTKERTVPFFKEQILPLLQEGKNVFICAHGNSLRSIMMFLDNLSADEVVNLELETGKPIIYTFTENQWNKTTSS